MNNQVNIYMPLPKPNIDNYTEKINNITPTKTAGLPTTTKTSIIGNTIGKAKGELKNKVCGAIDLVSDIKTGLSSLATDVKNINVSAYINSGVDAVKGKLNEVKELFKSTSEELSKSVTNIKDEIKNSLNDLEEEVVQQVESAKLAAAGIKDTVKDIGNMGNNLVKDISTSLSSKGKFCDEKTEEAATGVEEAAQAAAPVATVVDKQKTVLVKADTLAGPMTEEELDKYLAGQAIIPDRFKLYKYASITDYYNFSPYEMSDYFATREFRRKEDAANYPIAGATMVAFDTGSYGGTYFAAKSTFIAVAQVEGGFRTEESIEAEAKRLFEERFPGQKYL